jgi:tRNA (cytosine34-C5)-methyltransferase
MQKQRTHAEDSNAPPTKKQKFVSSGIFQSETNANLSLSQVEMRPPIHTLKKQPVIEPLSGRSPTYLNDAFITYYQAQNILPEDEWPKFIEALKTELPTTFRITSTHPMAYIIKQVFIELFVKNSKMIQIELEGGRTIHLEPPRPLEWYPNQMAWHYAIFRKAFKKSPQLQTFKRFLTLENDVGRISRQEEVSMIPPLLLDVRPHHVVLDMCAAPGSKTAQLLEFIHSEKNSKGTVIANDVDLSRCYMLAHQTNRLASPSLLITNYEAENFPLIPIPSPLRSDPNRMEYLFFDRILCDVPCSGDGTIRKSPSIGREWNTRLGARFHQTQIAIGRRGVELLRVGGLMVYSTCSLNPIENEAVVAEILRKSNGKVELVDVSDKLPSLKRRPGLNTWRVFDKTKEYKTFDEVPERKRARLPLSMFPPTSEETTQFHLERCMRIYPHLQDTGGFFICLMRKTGEIPTDLNKGIQCAQQSHTERSYVNTHSPSPDINAEANTDDSNKVQRKDPIPQQQCDDKKTHQKGASQRPKKLPYGSIDLKEEPFVPLGSQSLPFLQEVREFYGIGTDFALEKLNLLIRSKQEIDKRNNKIYFVNDLIYHIVLENNKAIEEKRPELRLIHLGLRIFENEAKKNKKLELKCDWRLVPESLDVISSYITKRIVPIGRKDFEKLLSDPEPVFFTELSEETGQLLKNLSLGCCIFQLQPEYNPNASSLTNTLYSKKLSFIGWRGYHSCKLFIPSLELQSLRNLYLSSDYNYVDPKAKSTKDQKSSSKSHRNATKNPTESSGNQDNNTLPSPFGDSSMLLLK